MGNILSTNNLSKNYGNLKAVDNLNLEIESGQIFGMLGPNGSGKTTTLAMLLGVINPSAGGYSWFEKGSGHQLRKKIGSILEHPIFYPYMSATQNLEVVAEIKGVHKNRIEEVIRTVGLAARQKDPFRAYSLGMKQRLAIGAALLSDPDVLIFDEPTNGLDPQGIAQIRQLIIDIAQEGKTIILASHLLDEVQRICTHFGVLRFGKLIHTGNVKQDFSDKNLVVLGTEETEKTLNLLESASFVYDIEREGDLIIASIDKEKNSKDINQLMFDNQIVLNELSQKTRSLEEQFLEILKSHA